MNKFLQQLEKQPESINFEDTISIIEQNYIFTPCAFTNGEQTNAADQNNGSCKIFAFAQLQKLSREQTLHCFGDYYRKDVVENPHNQDHQNIRQFMQCGWQGISFENSPLAEK